MTDPTPQAVTCKCGGNLVRVPGRWWVHQGYGPRCDNAEPVEPSPAPQAEREWFVADSMPEAMKTLADKLKQAESALTTMREERDRAQAALTYIERQIPNGINIVAIAFSYAKPVLARQPEGESK